MRLLSVGPYGIVDYRIVVLNAVALLRTIRLGWNCLTTKRRKRMMAMKHGWGGCICSWSNRLDIENRKNLDSRGGGA